MKLSELLRNTSSHAILFGDSKSGKSTLISKLAENGFHLIWVSLDNGHGVLHKLSLKAQENIDIIVLPDVKNFPVAIDTCRKLLGGEEVSICHAHGIVGCTPCKTHKQAFSSYCFKKLGPRDIVVFDHLTQLTDSCMALICKDKPVDYKPKLDDWGSLRFHMQEVMSNIQQAKYNIIAVAQVMETEMEDGKKKLTPQVGSREFGKSVGSYFDHIIYCEVSNLTHKAGSKTTFRASVLTGSRGDVAIEDQKEELSLVPFFSLSTIPEASLLPTSSTPRMNGEEAAREVLTPTLPAAVPVPESTEPAAGKTTSMHAKPGTSILDEKSKRVLEALKRAGAGAGGKA